MIFMVTDGTEATDAATSYASVAFADDYLSITRDSAAWLALTQLQKETFLMFASRFMDETINYDGQRTRAETTLLWPRTYAMDCDGLVYAATEIPPAIRAACVEMAVYYAINTNVNINGLASSESDLQSIKVDVITITWKQGKDIVSSTDRNKYPWNIRYTLRCLGEIRFAGGVIKSSRFKPICGM